MQKFLKSSKPIIILIVFLFAFFIGWNVVVAGNYGNYGLDQTLGAKSKTDNRDVTLGDALKDFTIPTKIGQIVGAVLAFVGVIFFVIIIYGGFMWMTAGGNEEKVKKAIELIVQAVVGLIIIGAAYLITKFIGEKVIG